MSAIHLADGIKGIPLSAYPAEAWVTSGGETESARNVIKYYKRVPWLYRAVDLRMKAVKRVPLTIKSLKGKGDVESFNETEFNALMGYRFRLRDMLAQWEGHLTLYGAVYGDKQRNMARKSKGFRALHPNTIKPKITEADGLIGFERILGGRSKDFGLDDYVYAWLPNLESEIGPGTPPAEAALRAARVLRHMQVHVDNEFEGGALKSTIAVVKDTIQDADKSRLESWMNRAFGGGINRKKSIKAISSDVDFKDIGTDLSDLAMPELTDKQREDVATALGVPQTMLFSNAANYATSQQDYRQFYDTAIIPDLDLMLDALNEQFFEDLGFVVNEAHEQLEFYQDDKESESLILLEGVDAGLVSMNEYRARMSMSEMTPAMRDENLEFLRAREDAKRPVPTTQPITITTAPNVGDTGDQLTTAPTNTDAAPENIDSTEGLNGAQINAALTILEGVTSGMTAPSVAIELLMALGIQRERAERMVNDTTKQPKPKPAPEPDTKAADPADIGRELAQWRKYALNRLPGDISGFTPEVIPALYADIVSRSLEECTTADEIKAVFTHARELLQDGFTGHAPAPVEAKAPQAPEAEAVKGWATTSAAYHAALTALVLQAFDVDDDGNPGVAEAQFVSLGFRVIDEQFAQAYKDGLKDGGLDADNLNADQRAELKTQIQTEHNFFRTFATGMYEALDLAKQAAEADDEDEATKLMKDFEHQKLVYLGRLALWVSGGLRRVYDAAWNWSLHGKRCGWRLGPTDHCDTCLAASEQIHTYEDWADSGVMPRATNVLKCNGHNCKCNLFVTDDEETGDISAIPRQ